MNTTADLKLLGVAQVNGRPLACGACGNTFSLEVHKRSPFETAPAWVCCLACGHGADDPAVTTGLVDAVLSGWADRQKAAERDVFTAEWRGTVLAGELVPTVDIYQAAAAVRVVHEGAAPHVKRWWRGKKAKVRRTAKAPVRLVRRKTADTAAGVKVRALSAAWTLQTGGAGVPAVGRRKLRRCKVKGCRGGMLTIRTRVHSTTGRTQTVKVACAVCGRA